MNDADCEIEACLPLPVTPVVDDVGWWSGRNDLANNGPARTGLQRDHVPADYAAIVRLGQKLGIRVQAAMILCEWDRRNVLRALPASTWLGAAWDNSRWVGTWLDEAARIIKDNPDHFEFALHGLAHSAWPAGKEEGSEWFDMKTGRARPYPELVTRLRYCRQIMQDNGFDQFPETFLSPCSHYRFGAGATGLTAALREMGIKYLSASFGCHNWAVREFPLPLDEPGQDAALNTPLPDGQLFTVDAGLMVVERVRNFVPWDAVGCRPTQELGPIPLVGLHWPNILHLDPERNDEIVDGWVDYLRALDRRPDRLLAADTPMCWTLLAYQQSVDLVRDGSGLTLDFTKLDSLGILHLNDWFVLKVVSERRPGLAAEGVRIVSVSRHVDTADQWLVRLQRLPGRSRATVSYLA